MTFTRLIAGAMSGTSADGVDVAIVEIAGRGLQMSARPIVHAYEPFAPEQRKQILDVRQQGGCSFADLAEIGRQVTLAYARCFKAALAKANISADQVEAIAAHGQTLFHAPPNTIQYFDPSLLAFETGVQVVSDFRRADLAAGGQGAPLVPFADWILFRHPTKSRVILNIGGIANLTYLKAGGSIEDVIAFDTGPGNCIGDWLCREHRIPSGFDEGGKIAATGRPNKRLFGRVMASEFFKREAPKSTDGPEMIAIFENERKQVAPGASIADLLSTANLIAATAIVGAAENSGDYEQKEYVLAGGGTQNTTLMAMFKDLALSETSVLTTDALGIGTDQREAIAFALLGAATLDGEPSNVPSATGASRRVVLGSITPRPIRP
jgi:anhydro-N-acetylmuramic acid kinase